MYSCNCQLRRACIEALYHPTCWSFSPCKQKRWHGNSENLKLPCYDFCPPGAFKSVCVCNRFSNLHVFDAVWFTEAIDRGCDPNTIHILCKHGSVIPTCLLLTAIYNLNISLSSIRVRGIKKYTGGSDETKNSPSGKNISMTKCRTYIQELFLVKTCSNCHMSSLWKNVFVPLKTLLFCRKLYYLLFWNCICTLRSLCMIGVWQ